MPIGQTPAAAASVRRWLNMLVDGRQLSPAQRRVAGFLLDHPEEAVWLSAAQVREAANDPNYPSAYQLLPPPGEPFGWDDVAGNAYGEIDVYDLEKAEQRGLNVKGLQAAIDFQDIGLDQRNSIEIGMAGADIIENNQEPPLPEAIEKIAKPGKVFDSRFEDLNRNIAW